MKDHTAHSLEEAKKRISYWRVSRTKRHPIPENVWDAVLPLISRHSYATISKELGLSYQQIKNKLAARTKASIAQTNPFVSVEIPIGKKANDNLAINSKMVLSKPDGVTLEIDGATLDLIREIVASFVVSSC